MELALELALESLEMVLVLASAMVLASAHSGLEYTHCSPTNTCLATCSGKRIAA